MKERTRTGPGRSTVVPRGELSRRTEGQVAREIVRVLGTVGRAVVDLAELRLRHKPAIQVFATAYQAAGGWPGVRLALARPGATLGAALRDQRVDELVPVHGTVDEAYRRLDERPVRLIRRITLDRRRDAAADARRFIAEAGADWRLSGGRVETLLLTASELVTNAVVHARTGVRLSLEVGPEGSRLAARDGSRRLPRPYHPAPEDTNGRGLVIVSLLATAWGVQPHSYGKTVWATFPVDLAQV